MNLRQFCVEVIIASMTWSSSLSRFMIHKKQVVQALAIVKQSSLDNLSYPRVAIIA